MKFSKLRPGLFLFTALIFSLGASAHGGEKHDTSKPRTAADSMVVLADSSASHFENKPALASFPTLHPLVVHVPIMLLILAAIVQWVSFLFFKKELTWVAWTMLFIGYIGAYAASNWFHAHAGVLPPPAKHLLEEHERYAEYTIWFSGAALLVQSVNLFFLKRRFMVSLVAALLITASAVFVALAGHHGAELVHKHGVGAKGYLLEQHHH